MNREVDQEVVTRNIRGWIKESSWDESRGRWNGSTGILVRMRIKQGGSLGGSTSNYRRNQRRDH